VVAPRAFSLSHMEFDFVWERLDVGERPYPLEGPSHGMTFDERDQLRKQVFDDLSGRGLADGDDLAQDLEDMLLLLVRNSVTIDGQLMIRDRLQVLAAARGERGVLAVLTEDVLRLIPVRGTALPAALVQLLPDTPPGPGGEVRMPNAAFTTAVEEYERLGFTAFESALADAGVTGRDIRTLATLVETDRRAGGQFAANATDRMNRRTRTPVLNWVDTDAGRYSVQASTSQDGETWLTFAPADSARIEHRLRELLVAVTEE
jgi:ESX secretion-associated protein EspG